MSDERRNFLRRETKTQAVLETRDGTRLDAAAEILNLSIAGARMATPADLVVGEIYRVMLTGTSDWFDIQVQERIGQEYRCRFETPWDELQDVIRQSDDMVLLVLESSDPEALKD